MQVISWPYNNYASVLDYTIIITNGIISTATNWRTDMKHLSLVFKFPLPLLLFLGLCHLYKRQSIINIFLWYSIAVLQRSKDRLDGTPPSFVNHITNPNPCSLKSRGWCLGNLSHSLNIVTQTEIGKSWVITALATIPDLHWDLGTCKISDASEGRGKGRLLLPPLSIGSLSTSLHVLAEPVQGYWVSPLLRLQFLAKLSPYIKHRLCCYINSYSAWS